MTAEPLFYFDFELCRYPQLNLELPPFTVKFEMTPAPMARRPFQKVAIEKVTPIHSGGNPKRSVCSYTYLEKFIRGQCYKS